MTTSGRAPEQPGPRHQADGPLIPDARPGNRDMREMKDPYDLPFPDLSDRRPAGHPKFVIVVDQLRDWRPGQPSLAELLETRPGRTRVPEPDLEAEP
jgi:hypothetical protein